MNNATQNDYAKLSSISITMTTIVSAVHHIYRDGLGLMVPWVIIILLPHALIRWFAHTGNKWPVWIYGLYNLLIIAQLGVVDGFLDHTLKALGFQHLTFLPGGDAEVVKTVFSLWSPQAGNIFYEGTGVLTFIGSVFATVYLFQFLRRLRQPTGQGAKEQLRTPGEIGA